MSENIVEALKNLAEKLGAEEPSPETITEAIDIVTENVSQNGGGALVLS